MSTYFIRPVSSNQVVFQEETTSQTITRLEAVWALRWGRGKYSQVIYQEALQVMNEHLAPLQEAIDPTVRARLIVFVFVLALIGACVMCVTQGGW